MVFSAAFSGGPIEEYVGLMNLTYSTREFSAAFSGGPIEDSSLTSSASAILSFSAAFSGGPIEDLHLVATLRCEHDIFRCF